MPPSLAELRARPDDRELLLVYADWLAGQGDPRGELIAVQDAEMHCASVGEFERTRARAVELVEGHAELCPDLSMLEGGPRQKIWAVWRGGFVRRLEILVDRPAPGPGAGLRGWSELIASMLAHPSMTLLEELLVRVDLRGEPLDETAAALAIVVDGVAGWRAGPFTLALWTYRLPRAELRDRLHAALPGIRKLWYSTDITRILPPRGSPIVALERVVGVERGYSARFDLVWFDARGNFCEQFISGDPSLSVHVRHIAEQLRGPTLACVDAVPQRRIARLIDELAARFGPARSLAPRRLAEPRPEPVAIADACERLADDGSIEPLLARGFALQWWWVEERCEDEPAWTGLIGLGPDQLLTLARVG